MERVNFAKFHLAGRFYQKVSLDPHYLFLSIVAAVALYLVVVPLLLLVISSFSGARPGIVEDLSFDSYARAYLDLRTYILFKNTFIYATGATLFGLTLGTILAWLVERTNMPLRNLVFALVPLLIVVPGVLTSIAWIFLLSPKIGFINKFLVDILRLNRAPFNIFSIYGMCFVQGLSFSATVFLMVLPAFRRIDPALEEAAAINGAGIMTTFRRITLQLMLPSLLSAAIYTGVVAIEVFEIPAMIGMPAQIPVFSTKLYAATHGAVKDYGMASALAMSVLLLGFIGIYSYGRVTKVAERFATVTGKDYRPRLIDLGLWKYLASFFSLGYLTLTIIVPLFTLFWVSLLPWVVPPSRGAFAMLTLNSYREVLAYGPLQTALKNTLIVMVTAAGLTMILSSLVSWIIVRSHVPGRRLLDVLVFTPHGVPGIVVALSLIWVYLFLDFIPIYGTVWIIALAFVTKYISFGTRTTNAAMLQLHRELEEAGATSGGSWGSVFARITLPLLLPAVASVGLFVAIHAMRDLSIPVMLATGNSTVLAVVVWDLWNNGRASYAAAAGVMLVLLITLIVLSARILGYRLGHQQ